MHEFIWDARLKPFPLYLSVFTQIHEIIEADEEDPEKTSHHQSHRIYYFTKVANLLPPIVLEKKQEEERFLNEREETQENRKEIEQKAIKEDGRIRPEFFLKKNNYLFNPDAFLHKNTDDKERAGLKLKEMKKEEEADENEKEKKELIKLGKEVREEGIKSFLREMDDMEVTPVSGKELCEMMHLRGLNLKHLGKDKKRKK